MYGIPLQTDESWQQSVRQAIALKVPHVSMYGLQVEEGTALARLVAMGAYTVASDEAYLERYHWAIQAFAQAGLHWYEFSNLSQPGFESRHNLAYWQHQPYWAFGPSAHGFVGLNRYQTANAIDEWLKNPLKGETELASAWECLENSLIFGLRQREGVCLNSLAQTYALPHLVDFLQQHLAAWLHQQAICLDSLPEGQSFLRLPQQSIALSNAILADFIGLQSAYHRYLTKA
jgi:oxygen-independent coproporphyrinogen III oxidase